MKRQLKIHEDTPPRRGTCGCGATRGPTLMLTQLPHYTPRLSGDFVPAANRPWEERDTRGAAHEPTLSRGAKAQAVKVPYVHAKPLNLLYSSMWRQKTCRKWYRWRMLRFLRCFSQRSGRVESSLCACVISFLQVHIVAVKGHRGVTFCSRICSPQ